ncbi:MAG: cereblon family protein [Thermodesulfobacteriota bacterium]
MAASAMMRATSRDCRCPLPVLALNKDGARQGRLRPGRQTDEQGDDGTGSGWFCCRVCRTRIVPRSRMIEVNGSHRHVFANPHGKVFEISCFSAAPGCVDHGVPTTECTWFAGCAWRFSLCVTCSAHLGWRYQSPLSGVFWGLILAALVES